MTKIAEALSGRRSYYQIHKEIPVLPAQVEETVKELTELVPDAFDMKSSRVVLLMGEAHDDFWNLVYDCFGGKVAHEKTDSFKAGAGTILYFYDEKVVEKMQETYPSYAENFPVWANQSSGMLQLSLWTALRELGIGATVQHYNPVIDEAVRKRFDLPGHYKMVAQMPFGGIAEEPEPKKKEDISLRVQVIS